ncbi:MAG: manganese efflux pump [Oscillospiraceae bacterium]|nr:manganese efflux pump [Oscillospiraceae bacterium]
MDFLFFLNSIALGVGLAMDAFSVSLANGLHEPEMPLPRMCLVAGVYALFQYAMPVIGWLCVHTIVELFSSFERLIPWIALVLLLYIGGRMLLEGLQERRAEAAAEGEPGGAAAQGASPAHVLTGRLLLLQGVATSIDALSVGFTIEEYNFMTANAAALIIAAVTFAVCMGGLKIGKIAGTRLSWKASVLGGCILIAIGIEIFLKGIL